MIYAHITMDELEMIEAYSHQKVPFSKISTFIGSSRQRIHNIVTFLRKGYTALDYFKQYKENKRRCGRRSIALPNDQQEYIQKMVAQGWTPDVIIGRAERPISCSVRTLYRQFKQELFDQTTLPMKGKRKPNGHQEIREK